VTPGTERIHPDAGIGTVALTVADLDRTAAFYERAIGLRSVDRDGKVARLGVEPGLPLVALWREPAAPPRPPRTTGLFHQAILVPTRADLARALERVARAGGSFTGASDHLVSEALYLADPEGNGIEIYRDRPREEWSRADGEIRMATQPLDLAGLMGEVPDGPDEGMPPGTRVGHVHLQVAHLAAAEAFYHGVLGFDVTVRSYPGALFVSAGGYHHHVGLNTWAGEGIPPPPPGVRGLRTFAVTLPSDEEVARAAARVRAAGLQVEPRGRGFLVADPSANRVVLEPQASPPRS
jgi:catechol 2,3-dioxygenase